MNNIGCVVANRCCFRNSLAGSATTFLGQWDKDMHYLAINTRRAVSKASHTIVHDISLLSSNSKAALSFSLSLPHLAVLKGWNRTTLHRQA